jgi:hypothetical protein
MVAMTIPDPMIRSPTKARTKRLRRRLLTVLRWSR